MHGKNIPRDQGRSCRASSDLVSEDTKHYSAMIHSVGYAKLFQSCPTLCDPIDGSPPGSPVPGILQVRGYQKSRNEQITSRIYPELPKTTKRSSSLLIFNSQLRECRARKTTPCSPPRTCLQRRPPGLFSLEICK